MGIYSPAEKRLPVCCLRIALVAWPLPSVLRPLGRSRILRTCAPDRLNRGGLQSSSRLQRLTWGSSAWRRPRLHPLVTEDSPDQRLLQNAAMIFSCQPQFGQRSRSISNTPLSSRAQLSRTGWWCAGGGFAGAPGAATVCKRQASAPLGPQAGRAGNGITTSFDSAKLNRASNPSSSRRRPACRRSRPSSPQ